MLCVCVLCVCALCVCSVYVCVCVFVTFYLCVPCSIIFFFFLLRCRSRSGWTQKKLNSVDLEANAANHHADGKRISKRLRALHWLMENKSALALTSIDLSIVSSKCPVELASKVSHSALFIGAGNNGYVFAVNGVNGVISNVSDRVIVKLTKAPQAVMMHQVDDVMEANLNMQEFNNPEVAAGAALSALVISTQTPNFGLSYGGYYCTPAQLGLPVSSRQLCSTQELSNWKGEGRPSSCLPTNSDYNSGQKSQNRQMMKIQGPDNVFATQTQAHRRSDQNCQLARLGASCLTLQSNDGSGAGGGPQTQQQGVKSLKNALLVLVQEPVSMSMLDFAKHIAAEDNGKVHHTHSDTMTTTPTTAVMSWRVIIFEVIFSIAVAQEQLGFRHNDLGHYNVRVARVGSSRTPTGWRRYSLNASNKRYDFALPYTGFSARIVDFGLSTATKAWYNAGVERRRKMPCAARLDNIERHSLRAAHIKDIQFFSSDPEQEGQYRQIYLTLRSIPPASWRKYAVVFLDCPQVPSGEYRIAARPSAKVIQLEIPSGVQVDHAAAVGAAAARTSSATAYSNGINVEKEDKTRFNWGTARLVGLASEAESYPLRTYGIGPTRNDIYDVHYFLSCLYNEARKGPGALGTMNVPQSVTMFLGRILDTVPGLSQNTGLLTHGHRLSIARDALFCGDPDIISGNDTRLNAFPRPIAILQDDFFAPLRRKNGFCAVHGCGHENLPAVQARYTNSH